MESESNALSNKDFDLHSFANMLNSLPLSVQLNITSKEEQSILNNINQLNNQNPTAKKQEKSRGIPGKIDLNNIPNPMNIINNIPSFSSSKVKSSVGSSVSQPLENNPSIIAQNPQPAVLPKELSTSQTLQPPSPATSQLVQGTVNKSATMDTDDSFLDDLLGEVPKEQSSLQAPPQPAPVSAAPEPLAESPAAVPEGNLEDWLDSIL